MEKLKLLLLDERNNVYIEYPMVFVKDCPPEVVESLFEDGCKDLLKKYLEY